MTKGPISLFRGGGGEQVFTGEASPAPGGGLPAPTSEGDVLTVAAGVWAGEPPGGGFVPQWAQYQGNPGAVNGNSSAFMTWDTFVAGPDGDFLDRSTLDAPTFVADGTYAVTVIGSLANTAPLQTFSSYTLQTSRFSACARGGGLTPMDAATLAAVVPAVAGDVLQLQATNEDGSQHSYSLNSALLVRLSDQA